MSSPKAIGEETAPTLFAESKPAADSSSSSLLSQVLAQEPSGDSGTRHGGKTNQHAAADSSSLDKFLAAQDSATRLLLWFGEERLRSNSSEWVLQQIERDIAKIDELVEGQLSAILHASPFQRLEASWRGIKYLVDKCEQFTDSRILIKLLNTSWSDLNKDFNNATELDQSQFFRKVYEEGMGQAGADSFSVILADYYVHPRLSVGHRYDDMHILRGLAQVAAAAFCPLIINAHPSMFAVDRFSDLKNSLNLQSLHSGLDFFAWQRFREIEDSRFVGLALPHMLMRRPYRDTGDQEFPFTERVVNSEDYLWGGAAFGMGEVLMRAFADSGWFANIRGAQRGEESGGVVTGPVWDAFTTEPIGNAPRAITDIVVSDEFERELAAAGFLPLCACKDTPLAAFYSAASAQKAKEYNTLEATMSARLSAMLNYILCVSRFGHYLKRIARNKIGSCGSAEELQNILQRWITDYVSPDKSASASTRLRKPLLEAEIKVLAIPGRAGEYESIFHLLPHHELDDMRVSIRLDTKLLPPRT